MLAGLNYHRSTFLLVVQSESISLESLAPLVRQPLCALRLVFDLVRVGPLPQ